MLFVIDEFTDINFRFVKIQLAEFLTFLCFLPRTVITN